VNYSFFLFQNSDKSKTTKKINLKKKANKILLLNQIIFYSFTLTKYN